MPPPHGTPVPTPNMNSSSSRGLHVHCRGVGISRLAQCTGRKRLAPTPLLPPSCARSRGSLSLRCDRRKCHPPHRKPSQVCLNIAVPPPDAAQPQRAIAPPVPLSAYRRMRHGNVKELACTSRLSAEGSSSSRSVPQTSQSC